MTYDELHITWSFWIIDIPLNIKLIRGYTSSIVCKINFWYHERLSIYPDRGIVCTYRRAEGLSTRIDFPNTLTTQSVGTNDALQGPASWPMTWNPVRSCPRSKLRLRLLPRSHWHHDHYDHCAAASIDCPFVCQVSDAIIGIVSYALAVVSDLIWLTISNKIRLTFSDLILLIIFDSIWLSFLPIWFESHVTHLFSVRVTQFDSQSSQASGSPTLDRVSLK